jgi:pimeloyl-ACP methyl ester carboxylesterase
MSTVTTKDGTEIYYKHSGPKNAQPLVFHHGWPLSGDDWDTQLLYFLDKGYRVIAHDRRGHGRSAQVSDGHDMDHYAADAAAVPTLVMHGDDDQIVPIADSALLSAKILRKALSRSMRNFRTACAPPTPMG